MFAALLHHISQHTSIGNCGQSVQSENGSPGAPPPNVDGPTRRIRNGR